MRSYLALVEAANDHNAFGIRFPDLPDVFSAADSEDDIIANAIEALRLWARTRPCRPLPIMPPFSPGAMSLTTCARAGI